MKNFKKYIYIACFLPQMAISQVLWQINKDTVKTWRYEDGDEFNSAALNIEKWKYWYGWTRCIFSQQEQEYYTDGENHEMVDGCLKLSALKKNVEKRMVDWQADTASIYDGQKYNGPNKRMFKYTAGMIQSNRTYKYGYFEIKFKCPQEKGYWPAFWLYGGLPNEEIDWMELKTEKRNAIHVGRHSQKREENKIRNYIRKKWWGDWVYFKGDLSNNWNIISGEWTPEYLKYYLNGEVIAYSKISMNIEKFLCANIAVPSNNGSFKPGPDTNITKPVYFEIDYIRVWNTNPSLTSQKLEQTAKFEKPNQNRKVGKSKLKSKTRFLYGKKKIHKNNGIIVSILPIENNKYELQVLGIDIPETANYKIIGDNEKELLSSKLSYGSTIIDLNLLQSAKFDLKVNFLNQTVTENLLKQ